ncbi:hypothetical protein [Salmonella enterica]|uniref:hypothetical protein n=1 Tax=Salmonella enterica TaxID=28901 RepID=UPI0021583669|nr:hypothetical protein [Salmonella enterica]
MEVLFRRLVKGRGIFLACGVAKKINEPGDKFRAIEGRLAEAKAENDAAKRAARRRRTGAGEASTDAGPVFETVDTSLILRNLPFEERLSKEKYETKIVKTQGALAKLSRSSKMKDHSVVVVFEGMDAAGKGGAIRRVTRIPATGRRNRALHSPG